MKIEVKVEMKQKVFGIPLVAIIALLLIPAVVLGALLFTKTMPGTITILAPPGLTFYTDEACINEITQFSFGAKRVGEGDSILPVYVKNTGSQHFESITATSDLSPDYAILLPVYVPGGLSPGASTSMNIHFFPVGATNGTQSFNITFECNGNA